jgi:hypothetical protein
MKLLEGMTSVFSEDKHRRQAAELLVHVIEHQPGIITASQGADGAANFCADFIETLSKRLQSMAPSQR